jgi:hypothetical protein
MKPFDVPITRDAATLRHVGRPKLRFPTSENTWPLIFLSFVHRTTSHGADGVSTSSFCWNIRLLDIDDCRDFGDKKAGEAIRGEPNGEGVNREENRRSKGWREVGL